METELTEDELRELDEICAFLWADDPTITILKDVDHPEDTDAPHGVNEPWEMALESEEMLVGILTQAQIRSYWAPRCTGPWARIELYGAGAVTVRASIIQAVKALDQCLRLTSYETRQKDTGAYVCRMNTSGTGWSMHAYGIALDINWQSNPYASYLITDMPRVLPERICAIRTNNGKQVWNWGGYWNGNKDAMHYEIVCTPADIRTGINWSTVYGGGSAPTPPQEEWIMASIDEVKLVLKEAEDRQNAWTRSEIDKAVAAIKSHNTTLRDGLAKLVRALASKLGYTI